MVNSFKNIRFTNHSDSNCIAYKTEKLIQEIYFYKFNIWLNQSINLKDITMTKTQKFQILETINNTFLVEVSYDQFEKCQTMNELRILINQKQLDNDNNDFKKQKI